MSGSPAGPSDFDSLVQLSVMRALLGEIMPEMRAITVDRNQREVVVRVFHEGVASDELIDTVDVADTEMRADFPSNGPDAITLETVLVRSDAPEPIPPLGMPLFACKGVRFAQV